KFARSQGIGEVVSAKNGTLVRLAPGPAQIIDTLPAGRLYKDGNILIAAGERAVQERRKLAFAGIVTAAIAIDEGGNIAGDPIIDAMGLPEKNRSGEALTDLIATAVETTIDGLPKSRRRDP